jgi:glycosyltransferase involved in cell wall biosynthesis
MHSSVAVISDRSTASVPAIPQQTTHTVLIHQAFVGPEEAGGTRHYEFARRMVAEGHRFTIVASDLSYLTGRHIGAKGFITRESKDGIELLRAYTYKALHRSFFWRVASFLSFAITSVLAAFRAGVPDVVMGTTPPIFQAVSAYFVAFCLRRPFLLEVRDLWPAFAIDMGVLKHPLLISASRWLERFLYHRATHLLVNSPAYRDYLIDRGIPPEKVSLVANGADPEMFDPEKRGDQVRQQYGLDKKFVVSYAGALGMANDIDTMLRAAHRLLLNEGRIHFLLIGDGKERRNLEQKAQRMGLTNVTFTGAQPKERMAEFLAASDACVATLRDIPMFRTTYPNKVFDYMAAGRPTILAIDGVIRDVIEKAKGGLFVEPGNDQALAAAALQLCGDPALCARMGASARLYVSENFNRNEQAQRFCRLVVHVAQ